MIKEPIADSKTDAATTAPRILVVDNDDVVSELIQYNLEPAFRVDVCSSAESALDLDLPSYSLLLLDVNLGGAINGFELVEMLSRSEATASIPFIFCTAHDSEDEIIKGFDAGADDYIVKPFSLREMVARVKSVMRRHALRRPAAAPPKVIEYEGVVLALDSQRASLDGESLALSRTEYNILKLFMREPGRLFSRDEIFTRAWPDSDTVSARTIDVNISRLRKKIGPYASCIISRPGEGYGLMKEGEPAV